VLDAWGDGVCQLGNGFICWPLRRSDNHPADDEFVRSLRGEVGAGSNRHPADSLRTLSA
jgi:hypothetical protein